MVYLPQGSFTQKWQQAWGHRGFRRKLIIGLILLVLILGGFPVFFQIIEKRHGVFLNDWVLNQLPPYDLSVLIFILIWASTFQLLIRSVQEPGILIRFLWSYIFLCLFRMLTILTFPLEPPASLLPLADPIANSFYGIHFVTRDLFFSGHTATVFLIGLCMRKKWDKIAIYLASLLLGILLLVQHVHYTIDVIAAPFLTWVVYWIAGKMTGTVEPAHLSR